MIGELTKEQMIDILNTQMIGRIGCYREEKVYIVPITYALHDNCVYAHAKEGLKIHMMRTNPSVCFEVDCVDSMTDWRSVISWGTFEELKSSEEQESGMRILVNKLSPFTTSEAVEFHDHSQEPLLVEKGRKPVVFRICLEQMTGRFEKR